jgi:hypothetical protein
LVAVRPGDRFTITGLAGTFLKIGAASLLVRMVVAMISFFLILVLAALAYFVR